jgi:hypothetical protein
MGLGWLLAILRAVPSLERLFLHIGEAIKAHRADGKHEEELDHIDAAIANARSGMQDSRVSGTQWSFDVDRSPPVSGSGTTGTGVYSVSIEGGSEVEPDNKK